MSFVNSTKELSDLFPTLIEMMNEGLVIQDAAGQIVQFNQSALDILCLTADQMRGRTSYDPRWRAIRQDGTAFPGEEHPSMVALKTQKPVNNVIMGLVLPNNETRWIRINAIPFSENEQLKVVVTFSNITELVQRIDENRLVLETLGIGIWKFNPLNNHLHWDQSMYRLFEIEEKDFTGHYQAWEDSLSPQAKIKAISELSKALTGEKEFNTTFEITTKNGQKKQVGGRGQVIRNSSGEPVMMYGINWDRTKEFELELKLREEQAKSVHNSKLASLGEMSAGIAHEINNPLAIIDGNLRLLEKCKDDEKKFKDKLQILMKATHRITKIITSLRKFSRNTNGTNSQQIDFVALLEEVLIFTEIKSKSVGVRFEFDFDPNVRFLIDELELQQVLINLINNSIDAIKDHSEPWIKIKTFSDADWIYLQVIDAGTGLSAEVESRLFQPFFTTKGVGAGTGLGLSICKNILEQYQSTIYLNKQVKNTCFEVKLPKIRGD